MTLTHPISEPPAKGEVIEVAPGILWAQLPLPFRLNHVNVYLIEDGDGWAILDCGISNQETKEVWKTLLKGPLKGRKITRVIVTHNHPDHIGMAGWLCHKLDVELWCGRETFLSTMNLAQMPALIESAPYLEFYARNGMQPEAAEAVATRGHDYQSMITTPPLTFRRLAPGKNLEIGGREFKVMVGGGHCPEQIMLYLAEENVFLAADQVIEKISPNVSVLSFEPMEDPLGEFLTSLEEIRAEIPEDAFVVSGHRLPFFGLHQRCRELTEHHHQRCAIILESCMENPQSANDIIPSMFSQKLTPHETSFAFTEVLAHMNHLVEKKSLEWVQDKEGNLTARRL